MLIWLTTARTKRNEALGRLGRCNGVAAKPPLRARKGAQLLGAGRTGAQKEGKVGASWKIRT